MGLGAHEGPRADTASLYRHSSLPPFIFSFRFLPIQDLMHVSALTFACTLMCVLTQLCIQVRVCVNMHVHHSFTQCSPGWPGEGIAEFGELSSR